MEWLNENMELILYVLGAWEVILRIFPTTKNWSVVDAIVKVLGIILPNLSNDGKKFTVDKVDRYAKDTKKK